MGNFHVLTWDRTRILIFCYLVICVIFCFDIMLKLGAHVKQVLTNVQGRNNVLKSLAGSTFGKYNKETVTTTSILNYAAPIWTSQFTQTSWNKLQTTENNALRTITGCHLMLSHLHTESKK